MDPFIEVEKRDIKKKREALFANFYDDINEKVHSLQLVSNEDDQIRQLIMEQLREKFDAKKKLERTENDQKEFLSFNSFFEHEMKMLGE